MDDNHGPLFRTIGRGTRLLATTPLPQANGYAVIRRRAEAAGIKTKVGTTASRRPGSPPTSGNGMLEKAPPNHDSTRTTQLYDRRRGDVCLDEVERIRL